MVRLSACISSVSVCDLSVSMFGTQAESQLAISRNELEKYKKESEETVRKLKSYIDKLENEKSERLSLVEEQKRYHCEMVLLHQ